MPENTLGETLTNRELVIRAANDLQRVSENVAIGPTALGYLDDARYSIRRACDFVLDEAEQELIRKP